MDITCELVRHWDEISHLLQKRDTQPPLAVKAATASGSALSGLEMAMMFNAFARIHLRWTGKR